MSCGITNSRNYRAGCGSIVYAEDDYVCPYFSRPDKWKEEHGQYGPCGIDLQLGTNRCLHAILEEELMEK
jgi:hypothetical protein